MAVLCVVYNKAELLQEGIFFQTPTHSLTMFVNKKVGNQIIEARYIISSFKTDINVIVFHSHSSTVRMFPGKLQIILRKLSGVHIQADT